MREERRLSFLENRVLRKLFMPMRDEITWEWKRLHNEELNDLCFPPYIIQMIEYRRIT
jgi:hypothetical protein